MNKNKALLGTHVSIAGGFYKAIEEGTATSSTAIQIFTKSSRQWAAKPILQEDIDLFLNAQQKSGVTMVTTHASYLINLGSANIDSQKKSLAALIEEIKRCHQLKIPYLVLHPGTIDPANKESGLKQIGSYINLALQETAHCRTSVLVETMAGQGKAAGSCFEELAIIIGEIDNKDRIGVCFDTCHAFVAGYDFTTPQGYSQTFEAFDHIIGLQYLKMFHINDSKKDLGSRVDRHEHIGQGLINIQAFTMIMNDPRFSQTPKILETPKDDGIEGDRKNIETLRQLIK